MFFFQKLRFIITIFHFTPFNSCVLRQLRCGNAKQTDSVRALLAWTKQLEHLCQRKNIQLVRVQTLTLVRRIQTRSNDCMHSVLLDHYGANTDEHTKRKQTLQHAATSTATTLSRCREATDCFQRQASASLHS